MRNIDIEYKSREMMYECKKMLLPVILFISIVALIPSFVSNTLLMLILSVIVLPVSQGYITSSLKAYNYQENEIDTYEDGLHGIRSWNKFFGTYAIYYLIKIVLFIIEFIVLGVILFLIFDSAIVDNIYMFEQFFYGAIGSEESILNILGTMVSFLFMIMLPILAVILTTNIIYDLCFFPTFYLLEEGVKGFEAMGIAKKIMKGKKKQLFMLKFSFVGWFILSYIIGSIIGGIISIPIASENASYMLTMLISTVVSVFIYKIRYHLAMTIFYKEVVKGEINDMYGSREYDKIVSKEEKIDTINDEEGFNEVFTTKQKIIGFLGYFPIYYYILPQIFSFIMLLIMNTVPGLNYNAMLSWYNFIIQGIAILIAILMFKNVFKSAWHYFRGISAKNLMKLAFASYGLMFLANFLGGFITLLSGGGESSSNQVMVEELIHTLPLLMFVVTVIFAPIIEEFMFRGIIFRTFRRFGFVVAMLISGFLFGFIHVSAEVFAGNIGEMLQIFPYMFMGFVLAYLYEKSKSIAVPMYAHMFSNFVSLCMIFFMM